MNTDLLPQKRSLTETAFYELIVPNGAQTSYLELLSKLKFTEELIEYTNQFSTNNHKIAKKDDFDKRYNKALIGLKIFNDPQKYIQSSRNPKDPFVKSGNRVLTHASIQDFLNKRQTSSDLIQIYIEYLKPISRLLITAWEELLQMIQEESLLDAYICILIYIEHKNALFIINRSEKVFKSFVKPGEGSEKEEELVCDAFACKKFKRTKKEQNWTNEEFLAIIRKFYTSGAVDEEVEIPENFQNLILHDISSI